MAMAMTMEEGHSTKEEEVGAHSTSKNSWHPEEFKSGVRIALGRTGAEIMAYLCLTFSP
jgi:hypothetical protein